ncbi:MAG: catalase [Myxococcota bacterium]
MTAPSTEWKEKVAPGEEQRLAAFATAIAGMQRTMSDRFGRGRAFHRKPIAALRATLEVAPDLPEHARQGLFATPGRYDVRIRLSNGSVRPQKNSEPDIRGFALSIHGVSGESALGGPATTQDFLLINREVFGFTDVGPFVDLAIAASKGPLAIVALFIRTYGFFRGLSEVRRLLGSIRSPFSGFLTETFFSGVPVAWGPYAARLRLLPAGPPRATPAPDPRDEVFARLAAGPSTHALQVQFYVDERVTPIEDGAANWAEVDAPYLTVGTVTIPGQGADDALVAEVEAFGFDPWHALAAHRPLGHTMRARKAAYFASQQGRAEP